MVSEHHWRYLLEVRDGRRLFLHGPSLTGRQPKEVAGGIEKGEGGQTLLRLESLMVTVVKPLQQEGKEKDGAHVR